ncbi:MAG: hypothetical protein ABID38_01475 [Candidatus Diapherotrites archaeon]
MKKAIVFLILLALIVSGCTNNDAEKYSMQKEISDLYYEMEEKLESVSNHSLNSDIDAAKEANQEAQDILDQIKIKFTDYKNRFGYDEKVNTDSEKALELDQAFFDSMNPLLDAIKYVDEINKQEKTATNSEIDYHINQLNESKSKANAGKNLCSEIEDKDAWNVQNRLLAFDGIIQSDDELINSFQELKQQI